MTKSASAELTAADGPELVERLNAIITLANRTPFDVHIQFHTAENGWTVRIGGPRNKRAPVRLLAALRAEQNRARDARRLAGAARRRARMLDAQRRERER